MYDCCWYCGCCIEGGPGGGGGRLGKDVCGICGGRIGLGGGGCLPRCGVGGGGGLP